MKIRFERKNIPFEKTFIRTPKMQTVEPAEDLSKVIRQMMGTDDDIENRGIEKTLIEKAFREYHFAKKGNPYHDKEGKFTFAPGGAHDSDNNVSRETHESTSAWSGYIEAEREKLSTEKQSKKALYADDHYAASTDDCIAAMKEGKADELLDRYFEILENNGDFRPTKETRGQISINDEGRRIGYTEARRNAIQSDAECDVGKAEEYQKALDTYFSGESISDKQKDSIDEYVDRAPAYDGIMYRGLHFKMLHEPGNLHARLPGGYDEFMKNVKPGSEIDMNGMVSSWSSSEEVARGFAHHVMSLVDSVVIVCVNNRTSTPVDHLSTYGESEVLASSKAKWTVLHSETTEWPDGERKTWIYVIEKGEEQ